MKNLNSKLRTALIVICVFFSIGTVVAQEKITSKMLQDKIWLAQFPNKQDFSFETVFTANQKVVTFIYKQDSVITRVCYYLSDEIEKTFDEKKVGGLSKGKYIIFEPMEKNPENDDLPRNSPVSEILKLTPKELTIKNLENNSISEYKSK